MFDQIINTIHYDIKNWKFQWKWFSLRRKQRKFLGKTKQTKNTKKNVKIVIIATKGINNVRYKCQSETNKFYFPLNFLLKSWLNDRRLLPISCHTQRIETSSNWSFLYLCSRFFSNWRSASLVYCSKKFFIYDKDVRLTQYSEQEQQEGGYIFPSKTFHHLGPFTIWYPFNMMSLNVILMDINKLMVQNQ